MASTKQELRKFIKKRLSFLSDKIIEIKSLELSNNLDHLLTNTEQYSLTIQKDFILGGFASLKDEIRWNENFLDWHGRLAFPSVKPNSEREMVFRQADWCELSEGRDFGIVVKVPPLAAPIVVPQVLLVPGLAFSRKGQRLGRGGGFFDKYLETYTGMKIGICYSEQLEEHIPIEKHDQLVDYVVTDNEIVQVKKYKER